MRNLIADLIAWDKARQDLENAKNGIYSETGRELLKYFESPEYKETVKAEIDKMFTDFFGKLEV